MQRVAKSARRHNRNAFCDVGPNILSSLGDERNAVLFRETPIAQQSSPIPHVIR
jgi:hypothetical protein